MKNPAANPHDDASTERAAGGSREFAYR